MVFFGYNYGCWGLLAVLNHISSLSAIMCSVSVKKDESGVDYKNCLCSFKTEISGVFIKRCKRFHLEQVFSVVKIPQCNWVPYIQSSTMMTSSNGNIFCITGLLWGESTSYWWVPLTKASDMELWCFLWSEPDQTVEQTIEASVISDAIVLIMTSFWIKF